MDAVEAAFAATPRPGFLPADQREQAGHDGPLEIGYGQTNSQPSTVAAMLRLLDVRAGQRVLDVGSGSGWTTALLAHLVGRHGHVRGIEVVPELVTVGAANLAATDRPWASISAAAPEVLGDPDHAPYDRILVSAEARRMPTELLDQLADAGRMVVPVAGVMRLAVRDGNRFRESRHGHYRFVPLR